MPSNEPTRQTPALAAIYTRVSTFDQVAGRNLTVRGSLEAQESQCREAAAGQGWQVASVYSEPGVSGEKFVERTALQQMIADARAGKFGVVLAVNGDRLARAPQVYHTIVSIVEGELGIPLYLLDNPLSVDPNRFDPTDESRIFLHGIESMFASADQAKRRKRLEEGKRRQVEAGRYIFSSPPYGYRIKEELVRGGILRVPVPDPAEYWIIESLPGWVITEKLTDPDIIVRLTRLGALTRKGRPWGRSSISAIIRNEFYAGFLHYGGKAAKSSNRPRVRAAHGFEHPWTWQQYQEMSRIRAERNTFPLRQRGQTINPLAGVLRCGHCGGPMKFVITRPDIWGYFFCGRHSENKTVCQINRTHVPSVITTVWGLLDNLASEVQAAGPTAFYERMNDNASQSEIRVLETRLADIRKQLDTDLTQRKRNLQSALLSGNLLDTEYREMADRLLQERDTLVSQEQQLTQQLDGYQAKNQTGQGVSDFLSVWLANRPDPAMHLQDWPEEQSRLIRAAFRQVFKYIRVKAKYNRSVSPHWWDIDIEVGWKWE